MLRRFVIITGAMTVVSCNDATGPLENGKRLNVKASIVDARNGGGEGFYFLPPIATAVAAGGAFDPGRLPVVEICALASAGCGDLHARFTTTGGPGTELIRVDSVDKHYSVQWHTRQTPVETGETYRIRVLEGNRELGHADARILRNGSESRALPEGTIGVVSGGTLPIKFRLEVSSGASAVRIEVVPGGFLLPGEGSTLPLSVRAYDANGGEVAPGQVSWSSSAPSTIAVSASGVASAAAASGSAQVTAQMGSLVSAPVLGLVSQVAAGALLIGDDNVLPPPVGFSRSFSAQPMVGADASATPVMIAVDPTAPYQPGWRYKVWLTGVTPNVGQVVVSQGEAVIGGRVVSVTPSGDAWEVTLELIPLAELLPGLSIDERFVLEVSPLDVPQELHARFDIDQAASGRMTFTPKKTFAFARELGDGMTAANILDTEIELEIGPFSCKVVSSASPVSPVVSDYSYHVDPDLDLDVVYSPGSGLQKLLVRGSIDAGVRVRQIFPTQVEQKLECEIQLATIHLPFSGPIALFLGGQVPVGVGFEVGGKLALGNIGFDASVSAGATLVMGLDYTAGPGPFAAVDGSSPLSTLELIHPDEVADLRSEFSAGAFLYGKLEVGNPFFEDARFEVYGVKAGPKQSFQFATAESQVGDPAYASAAKLSFDIEGATGSALTELGNLLGINMSAVKFEKSFPLAQSPKATAFTITPANVRAMSSSFAGEKAKFDLVLDPVTYMTFYSVDSVSLYRKKPSGPGAFVLEKVPGGCGHMAATAGQSAFSCETVLPESWGGEQTVYAFVSAKIFGASIPLLFELGDDSKAVVTVDTVKINVTPATSTLAPGATTQFSATVTGLANTAVTWSATGGTISASGLYTAGQVTGNYRVIATSVADATLADTAAITISAPAAISLVLSPMTATVLVGDSLQFTATVLNSTNQTVYWNASGGTISQTGMFKAGTQPGTGYNVNATPAANPAANVTAVVKVSGGPPGAVLVGNNCNMSLQGIADLQTNSFDRQFIPYNESISQSPGFNAFNGTLTTPTLTVSNEFGSVTASGSAQQSSSLSGGGAGTITSGSMSGQSRFDTRDDTPDWNAAKAYISGGGNCSVVFDVVNGPVRLTLSGNVSLQQSGEGGALDHALVELMRSGCFNGCGVTENDRRWSLMSSGSETISASLDLPFGRWALTFQTTTTSGNCCDAQGGVRNSLAQGSVSFAFSAPP